jgi:hypothetical protein
MDTLAALVQNMPPGLPIIVVLAALALVVLAFTSQKLRNLVLLVLAVVPAALLGIFGVIAAILWTPAAFLARILFGWLARRIARWLDDGTNANDPLRRGDREQVARQVWSEEEFPHLYRAVPPDILRPLYEDGKLTGGVDVVWLADRHMTEMALLTSVLAGITTGLLFLLPAIIQFVMLLNTVGTAVSQDFSIPTPVLERWPGQPVVLAPSSWWSDSAGVDVNHLLTYATFATLQNFLGWLLIGIGSALLITFTAWRLWYLEKSAPYTLVTKDADVRWPYRVETRELSNAIYRKQVLLSETYLSDTPLFRLGTATGSSRLRGDLAAPTRGQPLCLDRDSLFQHLLVLGGTGEGKTTAVLKPLMRQLMADPTYGFYVCDAKGVLWADALKVAQACGREDKIFVIGTGEGQVGVNPLANLTPTQVAATLRSVLQQVSGSASDSFWPEMAANILRHVLTLAQVYRLTEAGQKEIRKGLDPYSLWWAYQVVLSTEILAEVVAEIKTYAKSLKEDADKILAEAKEYPEKRAAASAEKVRILSPISSELRASLLYIETTWSSMANETKSGIIANVTQLLDGFAGARTLRERFASGTSDENTISMANALEGNIVLNALSSIEDGLPARLVLILLKTSLYREARKREAAFKAMTPRKDPQKHPCIVMMDEVQEIVTSDPASGLSDASFWNVARSTGLAGIFATQTLAALNQALGEAAAANFVQQARSKIFFRSEDEETIEYACWCAGSFERNRVFEDFHRESLDHRMALDGWSPFAPIDEQESVKAGGRLFWSTASSLLRPGRGRLGYAQGRKAYDPDQRFAKQIPQDTGQATTNKVTTIQMQQAAAWRAEDLERSYRSEGNETHAALTSSDVINMGRWHAFAHVQRAGAVRQDIIMIEHDYA